MLIDSDDFDDDIAEIYRAKAMALIASDDE